MITPENVNNLASQINAFQAATYVVLIGLVGFFARLWFKGRAATEATLTSSLATLATTVANLTLVVNGNSIMQTAHTASLAALVTAVAELSKVVNFNAILQAGQSKDIADHRRELDGMAQSESAQPKAV